MSKACDKVWHEGVIFNYQIFKSIGVSDSLLHLIESFLSNIFQRLLLNGQISEWVSVKAGVPQGSILGPLFCLIFIKLKSVEVSNSVLHLIERFLSNRFQRVLLNGQMSEWLPVQAGVEKGCIL